MACVGQRRKLTRYRIGVADDRMQDHIGDRRTAHLLCAALQRAEETLTVPGGHEVGNGGNAAGQRRRGPARVIVRSASSQMDVRIDPARQDVHPARVYLPRAVCGSQTFPNFNDRATADPDVTLRSSLGGHDDAVANENLGGLLGEYVNRHKEKREQLDASKACSRRHVRLQTSDSGLRASRATLRWFHHLVAGSVTSP